MVLGGIGFLAPHEAFPRAKAQFTPSPWPSWSATIDLAMASSILQFRNPGVFQIIDQHAYRAVNDRDYPLYSSTPTNRKMAVYFDYLDKLIELCSIRGLEFRTIDRLLYIFDKEINGRL